MEDIVLIDIGHCEEVVRNAILIIVRDFHPIIAVPCMEICIIKLSEVPCFHIPSGIEFFGQSGRECVAIFFVLHFYCAEFVNGFVAFFYQVVLQVVIFTTAFDDYMLKAFKVNSIDYLLKPIKEEELRLSLDKFKSLKAEYGNPFIDISDVLKGIRLDERQYKTRFLVKQGDKMISVQTEYIAFFQTRHGVVHLVTEDNKRFLMDQSLDELQNQLDPRVFYRANRQFVINYQAIATVHRYHKGKLLIDSRPNAAEGIIVSAEKASDFKAWLGD